MPRSLAFRFTLAFLLVSLAGVGLVAFFSGQATRNEFRHFMQMQNQDPLAAALADHYQRRGSWEEVEGVFNQGGMGGPMMMNNGYALADRQGNIIVGGERHHAGEHLTRAAIADGTAIVVNGNVVGTLLNIENNPAFGPAAVDFLSRVNRSVLFAALGVGALSILVGVLWARSMTHPLGELTQAARALAKGELGKQVNVHTQDELGELASAFNHMSADLARARDQRQQMTADIAHELRTPLSIIVGHAEALRDGVLPPTPETLNLVYDEAQRLNRLVEDLRTLSLAEAGELSLVRRRVNPGDLLERAVAAQQPRAQHQQIDLHIERAPGLPEIDADPDRLTQVLSNVLDNALRHTPAGGKVICRVTSSGALITFSVADSGPGVAPEDLPHIFDRFYRADKARTRSGEVGGSGLGLAIAKSIVEAHGGKIWAENKVESGAQVCLALPVV